MQNTIEYGSNPGEALELLDRAYAAFPQNPILPSYFGHVREWALGDDIRFNTTEDFGAPAWACDVRFALEHLDEVVLFWHQHRQTPDGGLGGGWGDDVELWRQWTPLLFGFEFANYTNLWQTLADGVYALHEMALGYTDHLSDVEHTAEMSGDTAWPIQVMIDTANFSCNATMHEHHEDHEHHNDNAHSPEATCAAHQIARLQNKRWLKTLQPTWTQQQRVASVAGGVAATDLVMPTQIKQIRSSWCGGASPPRDAEIPPH